MDYILRANYKINSFYFLRLQSGYSQNLEDSTFDDVNDSSVALYTTPSPVSKYLLMSFNAGAIAPTSKISRDNKGRQGALKTGVTIIGNPNRLIPGLGIAGIITATRNFNEYETTKAGAVNTAWSSVQTLSVSYDLPKGFSLSGEFTHQNTWSYQDVAKESFSFSQEVGYQLTKTFSLSLGHTNGGSIFKPNGTDSNVALVDENSSVIYAALITVF